MSLSVKSFFDEKTHTVSYVVSDESSSHCAIIDSVLDYEPASATTSTASADLIVKYVKDKGLKVDWILETHAHADHLSAAQYVKGMLGGQVAIGSHIKKVQAVFAGLFNLEDEFHTDGSQFDKLFNEGDQFKIGNITATCIHTPGHTPACMTYLIEDCAFVGDTLFMPDYGTARADFPEGDAKTLYRSIQKIFSLPNETRLFLCHDYKAPGRKEYCWETTVAREKSANIHVAGNTTEEDFVALRESRDATLPVPALLLPAIQVNIRAGQCPPAESNGVSYLKMPLNRL
jgi:glyoxylase-like metal-dependent hydrolase (beta-lactamase superfamily II)